jgi:hypothetical protein
LNTQAAVFLSLRVSTMNRMSNSRTLNAGSVILRPISLPITVGSAHQLLLFIGSRMRFIETDASIVLISFGHAWKGISALDGDTLKIRDNAPEPEKARDQ